MTMEELSEWADLYPRSISSDIKKRTPMRRLQVGGQGHDPKLKGKGLGHGFSSLSYLLGRGFSGIGDADPNDIGIPPLLLG